MTHPVCGATITPATFRFFRQLSRNNSKEWMDANRERYRSDVVEAFRALLAALAPAALKLQADLIRQAARASIFRESIATFASLATRLPTVLRCT